MPVGDGLAAFYAKARPTNIFVAFSGVDYQIELFAPKPGTVARSIVAQDQLVPVR